MLTHISIENFKGIRDRVEIDLKPITLLFGPNSAGKSTILHALLYAQEVFERHNLDADTTTAGGPFIDLGGFKSMIHGRDLDRTIGLGLRFDFEEGQWQDHELDVEAFANVLDCEPRRLLTEPKSAGAFLNICWSKCGPIVQSCQLELNSEKFATIENTELRLNLDHPLLVRVESENAGAWSIAGEESSGYTPGSPPCKTGSILRSALDVVGHEREALRLLPRHDALPQTESQLQIVERMTFEPRDTPNGAYLERKRRNMRKTEIDPTGTRVAKVKMRRADVAWTKVDAWEEAEYRRRLASAIKEFLISTVMCILGSLRRQLQDCRYLGPVREIPRRNAAPPSSPDPARWSTGLGAWDHLQSCDGRFVEEVSDWLSNPGRLNAGVRLNRRDLIPLDLAKKVLADLSSRRPDSKSLDTAAEQLAALPNEKRVFLVSNDSEVELSLHDVGVGISQLIPVVVTALDESAKLAAIEGPEYHLHPRLQADVADLFVAAAQIHGKQCLIELHSEHVILRLQRLIREGTLASGVLSVNVVRRIASATRVDALRLDDEGDFIDDWPGGFFPERLRELL